MIDFVSGQSQSLFYNNLLKLENFVAMDLVKKRLFETPAKNPTYKNRISAALVEVQNTVERQQLCEDVVSTLTEFSMYYRDLLDKVVSIDKEDEDRVIPLAGSAPSEELLKMTRAWREAEERLDFAVLWSID